MTNYAIVIEFNGAPKDVADLTRDVVAFTPNSLEGLLVTVTCKDVSQRISQVLRPEPPTND